MAGCTVQVWGIPSDLPPDRVADKLTIHFLRSRNGGGEISDVQVLPGSPAYALITFEALAVAQRILKVKNHVLCIGGKRYPLEVKAHVVKLSPDEIFVRVFMVVDYGKFPAGETLLKNLKKGYSSMQFDFDYRSTLCRVKGTFTELQAFSRDLLACLNIKSQPTGERLSSGSSHSARNTRMYDYQQEPDSAASASKAVKLPHWDQVCDKAADGPSPRSPVDGEALEQLEDFSLVMDSDIYLYIQRFCASEYQGILCQHHVDAVDVSSNDITILYLQPSPGTSGDMDTLQQSRLALQHLYQQLEVNLRKEKLSKGGLNNQELRALTQELQELYPQLLCHEDGKQLDLIGNLVDVSQAKQYVQHFSTRSGAPQMAGMFSSSPPSQPATSYTTETTLDKPKVSVDTLPLKLSPGKPELKAEHKLAANFSAPKISRSQCLLENQDSPVMEQAQLSGKHFSETHALGPSDPTTLAQPCQPHISTVDVISKSAAESQQDPKEWGHVKGGGRLTRQKSLPPFGSKENGTLKHPGDLTGSDPSKHHSLAGTSSIFQSLSLFDTTRTSLDSKPSESRSMLRRSSSFSLPKSKESNKPQGTGRAASGDNTVSEEMSLDSLQWSYLKCACRSAIDELCRGRIVDISEHSTGDCTVLTLQAADRSKLLQAKWKVENLVQKCPDLVCQSMSYSELAVDGPDDDALCELCSLLQGGSLQVGLSKDKYKLYLACPRDMLPGVTEAFHLFSSRRLHALKSSSLSPGPERTVSAGHPSAVQPSRSQDTMLDAALPNSLESLQMDLQHLDISNKTAHPEVLNAFQQLETDENRSPSLWRFPQAQEEANDHIDPGAVQGRSSFLSPNIMENFNPAALRETKEQLKTKVLLGELDIARLKQVLPDKFQFVKDKSRVGHHDAMGQLQSPVLTADDTPHSVPTCLCKSTAPDSPHAAAEQSPAAELKSQESNSSGRSSIQESSNLPALQTKDTSLEQESCKTPLSQCDACQDLCVTCQTHYGHALCRSCFANQPACCSSSLVAPGCKISGTFKISSLSQSLPGYFRDLTLQITYTIPNGIQGVGHPHPGEPYKGGYFLAFLPDNREGQKTAILLKKAFEQGLTFQVKSYNGEERVTWGPIPHKTSWHGGKARNGYPDAQYLHEVCTVLKKLGID
ncbi:uncharacterized protein LOC116233572 isoform X1 [Phasianus colchicus]|uniref:uncharacterized protein LOC116233572 isoform X1 n=1 Tax=Phasianus colchicus TaxID=9054 RepID=UPI00129D349E|nr:uncharacterized protein LOC116233572 isoform X1 [Phasianus colchicus]